MSNRILAILIIFLFISAISWFYFYFFVYYVWNLEINSNIDNYKVELYSKNLLKTFSFDCKDKKCSIKELAPINYDLKILKNWYKDFSKNISIEKNNTLNLDINLEKDIKLNNNINKVFDNKLITDKNKILNLKNSKLHYASFYLEWIWEFYFNKANNLELFFENKKIWSFDIVEKDLIKLENIYNNSSKYDKNYFYLEIGNKKFIYSIKNLDYKEINLNVKINYIKSNNDILSIVTGKWTFIYNYLNWKQEYFSLFNDFVFYKNWYIAIFIKDDKIRINNFWLEDNNKDKIIFFNTETKEKKLLYEAELDLNKIMSIGDKIIFIDKDNNEFSLNLLEI